MKVKSKRVAARNAALRAERVKANRAREERRARFLGLPIPERTPTHTRPHMIDLVLACALVDLLGDGAEKAVEDLGSKREFMGDQLADILGGRTVIDYVASKSLVLRAKLTFPGRMTWLDGEFVVPANPFPDTIVAALAKRPLSALVEHRWFHPDIRVKQARVDDTGYLRVSVGGHKLGTAFALRKAREHLERLR